MKPWPPGLIDHFTANYLARQKAQSILEAPSIRLQPINTSNFLWTFGGVEFKAFHCIDENKTIWKVWGVSYVLRLSHSIHASQHLAVWDNGTSVKTWNFRREMSQKKCKRFLFCNHLHNVLRNSHSLPDPSTEVPSALAWRPSVHWYREVFSDGGWKTSSRWININALMAWERDGDFWRKKTARCKYSNNNAIDGPGCLRHFIRSWSL